MEKLKVLITGATGLIGSALVRRFVADGYDVTCPVRSVEKAKSLFTKEIFDAVKWDTVDLVQYLKKLDEPFDYVVHAASPTASKYFVEHPIETIKFNTSTTTALLDYARNHAVRGIVYLSSLESYGTVLDGDLLVKEDFQGYVNPMETRSSYNMAKRICESLCHAYATEYDIPVKVVRLTQTISPFISNDDMRVFAQFARRAARGEDIELHTTGEAARQYIHIDDAVEAIICVMKKGTAGEAYNAACEDSYISVRDMADFVQKNFNPHGKVLLHLRDDMGYAPTTKLRLDTHKLQTLGWNATKGLYEMYRDIINHLKEKQ